MNANRIGFWRLSAILTMGAVCFAAAPAHASIATYAEYHLGEGGSLGANNVPLDSSGNSRNFTAHVSGSVATVGSVGVSAPGSTAYINTSGTGNEGWYAPGLFSSLPTDDFAFGAFARAAANTAATQGPVFAVGSSIGSFEIGLWTDGWYGANNGLAWIGGDSGVDGSFAADTWVHLALIRSGGLTTLYINGVAQGAAYATAPINNQPLLSLNYNGSVYFDGHIDEARVVTFTAGESNAAILNALQGVTVPTPAALPAGLASLGLLAARRRRHA